MDRVMVETLPTVHILLSTYNGARYLREQLASIQRQTHANWRLWVRDDGSNDGTLEVLAEFVQSDPRIHTFRDESRNLGAVQSFAWLLENAPADADYIMFCDQDDVWLDDKIAITLASMRHVEALNGPDCPILVHSDLMVVDEELNVIGESFWAYQNIESRNDSFNRLLIQNVVTGCTAMINAPLRRLCGKIPGEAIMHDWWLALVAAAFGKIVCLDKPTILYRQHGKNEVGAKRWSLAYILRKAVLAFKREELKRAIGRCVNQGASFANFYGARGGELLDVAREFGHLHESGIARRRVVLVKHGILKSGFLRNTALLLFV